MPERDIRETVLVIMATFIGMSIAVLFLAFAYRVVVMP